MWYRTEASSRARSRQLPPSIPWCTDTRKSCHPSHVEPKASEAAEQDAQRPHSCRLPLYPKNALSDFYCASVSDRNDAHHWQVMVAIKSNILRRMDTAPSGVRICCIKFVQQVVLVQTPMDPRVNPPKAPIYAQYSHPLQRLDPNDVSLASAPRDHPLITYASLEAEGQGLLDRLLDIIHGDHRSDRQPGGTTSALTRHSDALLVTAVLNSLGTLMQRRPMTINKILSSVLNFNALKLANSPMTPKTRVLMRSIERTTRALLVNFLKR